MLETLLIRHYIKGRKTEEKEKGCPAHSVGPYRKFGRWPKPNKPGRPTRGLASQEEGATDFEKDLSTRAYQTSQSSSTCIFGEHVTSEKQMLCEMPLG